MAKRKSGAISDAEKALAGALAGAISRVIVAPLDVVKIRMQTDSAEYCERRYKGWFDVVRALWAEEGIVAFWRGNVPALAMYMGYGAIQFALYAPIRSALGGDLDGTQQKGARRGAGSSALLSFASGALCGAGATVVTYPLDVLRTRFAAQGVPRVHRTPLAMAAAIVRTEGGARALFAGFVPAISAIGPNVGISFAAYDVLASLASGGDGSGSELAGLGAPQLSPLASAAVGCASGALAKVITFPLDTVKKRMQVASLERAWVSKAERLSVAASAAQGEKRGAIATLRGVLGEGVGALFRGLGPSLVKQVPAMGSAFFVFGEAKRWLAWRNEMKEDEERQ